jgi:NAD(P)-dependent dehydrogenase (short-subunit alcohol dehydrogenase family)
MKVVIADIREDHLEDAREELDGRGDVLPIPLDVTDRERFAAAADETERKFGKIHVLVNNAGSPRSGRSSWPPTATGTGRSGVCLGGTINGIVTIPPAHPRAREGGHIVSTASMSGLVPHAGAATYVTAKCAIVGLMEVDARRARGPRRDLLGVLSRRGAVEHRRGGEDAAAAVRRDRLRGE